MTASPGGRQASTDQESAGVVRELLAATSSRDCDLTSTIDRLGAACTARALLAELLFRACLEDLTAAVETGATSVTVLLTHRGAEFPATVSVRGEGVSVHHGPRPAPDGAGELPPPVVSQELDEVARALFGPVELVTAATRRIYWPGPEVTFPTPESPSLPRVFYTVVQRVIQVLDRNEPTDLAELAVRYGTDKWGSMHQYAAHYQRHFDPLRQHRLTVLEIGVGGSLDPAQSGASMRMWKRYFPRADVYGVDVLDRSAVDGPRLTTIVADQSDHQALTEAADRYGPFDIVIDDGSHVSSHIISSFRTLFPYLRGNGLYIIEDVQTCYWPEVYDGSDTDLSDPRYTVGFLKTLLDGLHHEEFLRPDAREPLPTDAHVKGVHVYRNLAVIEKGPNLEGSVVATVFRAARNGKIDQFPSLRSYRKA